VALHTGQQTYISLYTGGGGLDLGFRLANPDAVPLLYVERELPAAALVVDHIEAGLLDAAPVWADTGTLDCKPFADKVDWIIGGFPCQPFSVAGKQRGTEDQRWLWDDIRRLAVEIRPRYLFLENTPGLLVHSGIGTILGDLSEIGFDAEWTSIRASDVGAPHRRERVFLLAYSDNRLGNGPIEEVRAGRSPSVDDSNHLVADTISQRGRGWHTGGEYAEHAFPPGPAASAEWRDILSQRPDLAPAIESPVRGMDDGTSRGLARATQLRILGNGVVPQQAALAFHILKERITNGSASTSK